MKRTLYAVLTIPAILIIVAAEMYVEGIDRLLDEMGRVWRERGAKKETR